MSDLSQWQENNDKYLSAAFEWLRLRLTRLAVESTPIPPEASQGNRVFGKKSGQRTKSVGNKEIDRAFEAVAAAESAEPPPALYILSERFGLSRFEQEVLLLCAAMELDTRIANLCARAQGDPNRSYPTFALALALFDEPVWEALSPERPLRYWRLIEINQPGAQPLTTSALRAEERIVNYLKGLNYLDDRLALLLAPLNAAASEAELSPSQREAVATIVNHLEGAHTAAGPPVIQLLGNDGLSKQLVAMRAAEQLQLRLYQLPVELLPAQAAELETFARLWERESILFPFALYLDAHDLKETAPSESQALPLYRFLGRSNGLFFLDTRDIQPELGRATLTLDIAKPTPAEQETAWKAALGATVAEIPALLAGQFNLNITAIQQTAQKVLTEEPENGMALPEQIWKACLSSTRPRLDVLAQRLAPKATWDDLVLPEEEMRLLRQITDQVGQRSRVYDEWGFRQKMNRGLGINALFAGESGTGKTMAAEVIANDLRLNLYRIDLSAVVSKYIGETEKNLRRLFDAAEDGGAILFFDEADALFGKRSEVKDSHDRYANIEINYLLQRIETYCGLAILATNMKSALDHAFVRRLRFIVNFPFPGPNERKVIWQTIFPEGTPSKDLNYDRLSRLNLTGGSIHNIALNAAFLAAKAGTGVSMPPVLTAARAEFRKLEHPLRETDFLWQEPEIVEN